MDSVELVTALFQVRQQKSALEKTEKALLEELKGTMDADLAAADNKLQVGSFLVQRIPGTNTSIKADLLLERGVSPDIISYATVPSHYFQYKVKEAA